MVRPQQINSVILMNIMKRKLKLKTRLQLVSDPHFNSNVLCFVNFRYMKNSFYRDLPKLKNKSYTVARRLIFIVTLRAIARQLFKISVNSLLNSILNP